MGVQANQARATSLSRWSLRVRAPLRSPYRLTGRKSEGVRKRHTSLTNTERSPVNGGLNRGRAGLAANYRAGSRNPHSSVKTVVANTVCSSGYWADRKVQAHLQVRIFPTTDRGNYQPAARVECADTVQVKVESCFMALQFTLIRTTAPQAVERGLSPLRVTNNKTPIS